MDMLSDQGRLNETHPEKLDNKNPPCSQWFTFMFFWEFRKKMIGFLGVSSFLFKRFSAVGPVKYRPPSPWMSTLPARSKDSGQKLQMKT